MPKSKRAKVVHLTKVEKKGKEGTIKLFNNIRECVEQYPYCWVFSVENMRNTYLKDVRTELGADSRLFMGKTKVMAKALGDSPDSAPMSGTHLLHPHLHGDVGLLFTSRAPSAVRTYFDSLSKLDFARSGTPASRTFTIPSGILYSRAGEIPQEEDVLLSHTLDPELRRLGVPTKNEKGKVVVDGEYTVCKEGDVLDSRQTRLLKLFGVAMAEFRVGLVAYWDKEKESVEVVGQEAMEE